MNNADYNDFQKQQAIAIHSSQAEEFAASYQSRDGYRDCFNYSRKRLSARLEGLIPQRGDGLRLLDVGCGTGHHLAQLQQRGFEVCGVDGSEEMLKHARINLPNADLQLADVESLPFPDNCFDYIVCVEVLRYLPNPSPCVREMSRVLKPGGVCLATAAPLFNANGYWLVNRIANRVAIGELVRLKQFFSTSWQLRRNFLDAGLGKTEIHGVYCGPINWVEHASKKLLPSVLKFWEPVDALLADQPILREFSNMFLIHAVKAENDKG